MEDLRPKMPADFSMLLTETFTLSPCMREPLQLHVKVTCVEKVDFCSRSKLSMNKMEGGEKAR
jgi:hypothetical protein